MELRQVNKGYKCPNCKKFGLEPRHQRLDYMSCGGVGHTKSPLFYNFYRCRNCYAEFEEVKKGSKNNIRN